MRFSQVLGHTKIKQGFIDSVRQNRISHAQLLTGPEGNGKLALAIAYAQYINCTNKQTTENSPTTHDSCGQCASCKKYEKLIHPDLHFVFPVVRTPKIKEPVSDSYIKQWRAFIAESPYRRLNTWLDYIGAENAQGSIFTQESREIIRKLNMKTYEAEFKIMIVWFPEKMNISASNKLLKMIEEPPPKTLFLLVSEDTEQIINTIRSRTQYTKIPKYSAAEIEHFLVHEKKIDVSTEELSFLVHLANGSVIKAAEAIEETAETTRDFEQFTTLMRNAYAAKVPELMQWSQELAKAGRERIKHFLEYALRLVRENWIMNVSKQQKDILYMSKKEYDFSQKFHPFITTDKALDMAQELNRAHAHVSRNVAAKMVLLDLALQLTIIIKRKEK